MILTVNQRLVKLNLNRFRANSLFRLVILILKSAPLRKNSNLTRFRKHKHEFKNHFNGEDSRRQPHNRHNDRFSHRIVKNYTQVISNHN